MNLNWDPCGTFGKCNPRLIGKLAAPSRHSMTIMLRTPEARRFFAESTTAQAHPRTPLTRFLRSSQAQGRALSVGQGRQAALKTPGRLAHRSLRISVIAAPEAPTQEKCAPYLTFLLQPYSVPSAGSQ